MVHTLFLKHVTLEYDTNLWGRDLYPHASLGPLGFLKHSLHFHSVLPYLSSSVLFFINLLRSLFNHPQCSFLAYTPPCIHHSFLFTDFTIPLHYPLTPFLHYSCLPLHSPIHTLLKSIDGNFSQKFTTGSIRCSKWNNLPRSNVKSQTCIGIRAPYTA
jgi:hypothetical protein